MPSRWVGIDEAGYGPNLGPLVMTAVVAESPDDRPPDVWRDLSPNVVRAGGDPESLWIDDSKAIYKSGLGRDRLDAACLEVLAAIGFVPPDSFGQLLHRLGAGSFEDVELNPWLGAIEPSWPVRATPACRNVFKGAPWRLVAARAVVIGPGRFNEGLRLSASKAKVHQLAFARLIQPLWHDSPDGLTTYVRSDKHGGRHFYHVPLSEILPGAWIDRGEEGPALSQYVVRDQNRRLEIRFEPRADASDGLVALASIISKSVREHWMDVFNTYWTARLPGLRPTAGYPVDARRFRQAIEADCSTRGLLPDLWWRVK